MNLSEMVGKRYVVTLDEAYAAESEPGKEAEKWRYMEVKGKYGYVYPYSESALAVTFTSAVVANRFSGEDWKIIQNGDFERTILFPLESMDKVLMAIRPKKKRRISEETRQKLLEMGKKFSPFKKKVPNASQEQPKIDQTGGIPPTNG